MLQRIQSIYLLLAGICMAVFAFLVPASVSVGNDVYQIAVLEYGKVGSTSPSYFLSCLTVLIFALSLITIFKYGNLKLQKTLCGVCLNLTVVLAASIVIIAMMAEASEIKFGVGMYLLAVPAILFVLARMGVSHDQKLLRDSESFR